MSHVVSPVPTSLVSKSVSRCVSWPAASGSCLRVPETGAGPVIRSPSGSPAAKRASQGSRRFYRESAALPGPWRLPAAEPSTEALTKVAVSSWLRTASSSRTRGAAGRLAVVPACSVCWRSCMLAIVRGCCCTSALYCVPHQQLGQGAACVRGAVARLACSSACKPNAETARTSGQHRM